MADLAHLLIAIACLLTGFGVGFLLTILGLDIYWRWPRK